MNIKNFVKKSHDWTTYSNPRNKAIQLKACSKCGIIQGAVSDQSACKSVSKRVSAMFVTQGWVEHSPRLVS